MYLPGMHVCSPLVQFLYILPHMPNGSLLLIGASVSEPPSSGADGTFFYILCVVRRAAYPKLIQFNARNVYKIRIVQTPRVLQWSRTAILQQDFPSH